MRGKVTAVAALLGDAARTLEGDSEPLGRRVEEAATRVWSAMYLREVWPPKLLREANEIMAKILAGGPIKRSVPTMDDHALEELAESILSLTAEARLLLVDRRDDY